LLKGIVLLPLNMSWFSFRLEKIVVLLMISIILVLSTSSLHVFAASSKHKGIVQLPQQQQFVQVCCAWGDKLEDGVLTYKVKGADNTAAQQAVNNAIEEWNTKINGIKLVEVSDSNNADVQINLNSKAPKVHTSANNNHGPIKAAGKDVKLLAPGLSEINRDNNGFITQVTVNIATAASGKTTSFNPSEIEAVAKHELGHALGLGHADFITDLMSPILTGNTRPTISQCDVNGVIQANSWKMTYSDNTNSPSSPPVNHVDC
jgi:predicted Zn-dependent protease